MNSPPQKRRTNGTNNQSHLISVRIPLKLYARLKAECARTKSSVSLTICSSLDIMLPESPETEKTEKGDQKGEAGDAATPPASKGLHFAIF